MASDNIAGIAGPFLKRLFLLPGMIAQWFMYMLVGNLNYGKLRQQTRLARSPIITFLLSVVFWVFFSAYLLGDKLESVF